MKIVVEGKEYETKYKPLDKVWIVENWSERGCTVPEHMIGSIIFYIGPHGAGYKYDLCNVPMYMNGRKFDEKELYGTEEEAELVAEERNFNAKIFAMERGSYNQASTG